MKRLALALAALLIASAAYAVSLKEVRETYWKAGPLIQPVLFVLIPSASGTSTEYSIAVPQGIGLGTTFSASKETPVYNPGTIGNFVCAANPNSNTGNITCAIWKNGVSQLSCVIAVSTTLYQRCTTTGTFNVARGDLLTLVYSTTQASWNSTTVQTGYTITSSTGQNGNIFLSTGTLAQGASATDYMSPAGISFGTSEVGAEGYSPSTFWVTGLTVKLSGNDGAAGANRSYYVCHNATSTPAGCTTSTITCTTTSSSVCTSSPSAAPILIQPTDTFSVAIVSLTGAPAVNIQITLGIQPVIPGQYPVFSAAGANTISTSYTSPQGGGFNGTEILAWNLFPKTSSLTFSNLNAFTFNANTAGNTKTFTVRTGPYTATSPATSATSLTCQSTVTATSPVGGGGNLVGMACHNKGQVPAVVSGYSSVNQVSTTSLDDGGQKISFVMVAH